MLFQQSQELLLKGNALVMLLLFLDVLNHGSTVRFTHGEGAISTLPGEKTALRPSLLDPAGRIRLRHAQAIGNREIGGQAHQQVNVIRGSANGNRNGTQVLENSTHVSMRIGANGLGEEWPAFRRRKHHVSEQARKSMG